MYELFPGNYRWSYNAWSVMAAGGEFGDVALILNDLTAHAGQDEHWFKAWRRLAENLEQRAAVNLERGGQRSAATNFYLASLYHKTSEQFIEPSDPARLKTYGRALETFEKARALDDQRIERVEIPYQGSSLPAYFVPSATGRAKAPTVIFVCGLDTTKEISVLRVRNALALRGMNFLAVDTPGVGEALRLRKIYTRHDYEVPIAAVVDYLSTRADCDADRVGIIGSSLGGYYVSRAAAFEPRLKAVAVWGANYDYSAVWKKRLEGKGAVAAPMFQLMFITGTDTMDDAMKRIAEFRLEPVISRVTVPLLVAHGIDDLQIPADDARRTYEGAGSQDKELKLFMGEDGGTAHCQFDNHLPALLYISDWLKTRLVG